MRLLVMGILVAPLIAGCSVFGVNRVEEAGYQVLVADDAFELRQYNSLVVAETYVEGEFDQAGNRAFRKLFDYISGANTGSEEISMTAPVIADAVNSEQGVDIAMTAPVPRQEQGGGWRYMFVLPASYSLETAPLPTRQDVKLSAIDGKRVAVLRFSGTMDEEVIERNTSSLNQWMARNDLSAGSAPRLAQFNPPWTLPFLRRNEVMIDVSEAD